MDFVSVPEVYGFKSLYQEIYEETVEKIQKETAEKVRKETEEKVRKETAEKVRKETEERTRLEEKRNMAKKMLIQGVSEEVVASVCGFSKEELKAL